MRTVKDFDVKNKRVIVRCDFNVPLDDKGNILDDFRIKQVLPTIKYLINQNAKVILISHLGRPDPKSKIQIIPNKIQNLNAKKYTLKPVAEKLEKLLNQKVKFNEINKMGNGEVVLLENLRFYKEEEGNDKNFAKQLAKLGDIFIQEAFACCHRSHASIVSLPKYLPSGAGFLVEKELSSLKKIIKNPSSPSVAIIGGSKIKTKIKLLEKLSEFCDFVLVGSVLSLEILKNKITFSDKVILTKDVSVSTEIAPFDISLDTIKIFSEKILQAKTIFWNGPLGKIEKKEFQKGTSKIAEKIIESNAYSVAGGGETIKFLRENNLSEKFNHLSTGGGAMIDYIIDEELVGIDALK